MIENTDRKQRNNFHEKCKIDQNVFSNLANISVIELS